MRVVGLTSRVVRWPVAPGGAARDRTTRAAIVVELRTDDPRRGGLGEAAPLPGVSRDTLDDCARALDAFAATLPIEVATFDDALAAAAPIAAPAARFAIETALLALLDHRVAGELPIAFVVDTVDEARAAIAAGAAGLKLKIAPDRLAHVFAIAAACPGVPLRLDANRTFARADVPALVARLAGLPIEFLEEPCVDPPSIGGGAAGITLPLALDETLVDDPTAPADVHVLKPTVLGGLGACLAHARARGVASVVVTHALEGPIGSTAVALVARMIASPRAAGLAPHPALDAWPLAIVDDRPVDDALRAIAGALAARAPLAIVRDAAQRALASTLAVPAGTAFVLFTSGSTGAPQPVVLARATVDAAIAASAAHLGWRDDDRWLLALSVAHAGGLAVVARCRDARRPAVPLVGDLARALVDERITLASLVPTQLAALLDDPAWRPPAHLRAILLGGAAAPRPLLAAAAARGVPFLATYGMTETFGQVATAPLARAGDPTAPLVALPGVVLAAGTRAAPAPIRVGDLVTRDLGYLDDGALVVVGRVDDIIITGGENVHPATVEEVLLATPGVRAAIAFGVPDARWGQLVGAALTTTPAFDLAAARATWHAALPAHARPRRLAIVDALPQLSGGKLDRRAAAALPTSPIDYDAR